MVKIKPIITLFKHNAAASRFIQKPQAVRIKPEELTKLRYTGDELHLTGQKQVISLDEVKALSSENEKLKDQIAKSEVADVMSQVEEVGDFKVLPVSVKDVDMNALRTLGDDLKGKDVIIIDDMISSGDSIIEVATELKRRKAGRIFAAATFGLFTNGLEKFDKAYEDGTIYKVITTNCTYQMPELLERWIERV